MGREATCHCKWGAEEGDCKVLLEGRELILRSGLRRRVSLSAMSGVAARGSKLVFTVGQDHVELRLGPEAAQRWAKAIQTPPPSLAGKLGISRATRLAIVGNIQSEELKEALAEAAAGERKRSRPCSALCQFTIRTTAILCSRDLHFSSMDRLPQRGEKRGERISGCGTFFVVAGSSTLR